MTRAWWILPRGASIRPCNPPKGVSAGTRAIAGFAALSWHRLTSMSGSAPEHTQAHPIAQCALRLCHLPLAILPFVSSPYVRHPSPFLPASRPRAASPTPYTPLHPIALKDTTTSNSPSQSVPGPADYRHNRDPLPASTPVYRALLPHPPPTDAQSQHNTHPTSPPAGSARLARCFSRHASQPAPAVILPACASQTARTRASNSPNGRTYGFTLTFPITAAAVFVLRPPTQPCATPRSNRAISSSGSIVPRLSTSIPAAASAFHQLTNRRPIARAAQHRLLLPCIKIPHCGNARAPPTTFP
jgi:hypothetical protein